MPAKARRGGSEPLEVELQAVVSFMTWVLGTRLRPSAKTAFALNHGATSPPSGI